MRRTYVITPKTPAEELLTLAWNPDAPSGSKLAALFELKERRKQLSEGQAERLDRAEGELAEALSISGPVRTAAFAYSARGGRIVRGLPA
jgi:hypothetical protein